MGFAKSIWPGVLALTAAAFTAGAPAMAQQPQSTLLQAMSASGALAGRGSRHEQR